jgi:hypothetical protein
LSVIIPAFNAERFIGKAIQSVLDQTYRCHEIIVIDDGSTDRTKEVLKTFDGKIRCLYQQNKGPSAARNAGMQVAQGDLICFLDADDLWTPEKIKVQCEFMEQNPDIAFVCSDHEEFDADGIVLESFLRKKEKTLGPNIIGKNPVKDAFKMLLMMNFISTPTVMLRKSCLEKTGLFDESLWSIEDRDLWLRIAAHFPIACLPGVFCRRRVHHTNISKEKELSLRGKIKVLEKNWELFPSFTPSSLVRSLLADSYCQFGYLLLEKNQRWGALKAGIWSMKHTLLQAFDGSSCRSTPWWMSVGLIPAALLGWKLSRSLWQPLKGRK